MLRCLNNRLGYCSGTPQIEEETAENQREGELIVSHCKLDNKTCGKYLRFSDILKPAEHLGTGIRTIKVLSEKEKEIEAKKNKKKKKKGDTPTEQRRLI